MCHDDPVGAVSLTAITSLDARPFDYELVRCQGFRTLGYLMNEAVVLIMYRLKVLQHS